MAKSKKSSPKRSKNNTNIKSFAGISWSGRNLLIFVLIFAAVAGYIIYRSFASNCFIISSANIVTAQSSPQCSPTDPAREFSCYTVVTETGSSKKNSKVIELASASKTTNSNVAMYASNFTKGVWELCMVSKSLGGGTGTGTIQVFNYNGAPVGAAIGSGTYSVSSSAKYVDTNPSGGTNCVTGVKYDGTNPGLEVLISNTGPAIRVGSVVANRTGDLPAPPPSGKSWGCDPAEHYGPDGTVMELNSDSFGTTNTKICGNNTSWYATAASSPDGPVQGYPSIKYRYDQSSWVGCCGEPGGSVPLNTVKSWTSSWNVSFDHSTNSQAAYDLWFANNCGYLGGEDLMVWVDTTASRGTGGGPIVNAHMNIDGRDITFMRYGPPTEKSGKPEIIYKFNTNEPSGSVDLMKFVAAAQASGDLKACNSQGLLINNADFGFEVAGTGGAVKTFTVNDFHFAVTTNDGVVHY